MVSMFCSQMKQITGMWLKKTDRLDKGRRRGMGKTHIEYDDFGEYVETIDLVPVAQK